ncbi:P-loop containing nucleoside triphosphate hydrolase protein [Coniophora puteana RWD-64-598 SS2]|uniref:P-loop containing nucleoside triphosphate hydrolase protein n=1 Tax=Coniophora puteana (strain RWD-64-598) TaxID=741705 RepID=A0A5M3MDP2_CONPW|nr:P-loop containing nucleoside triphosphate hydrolase protein [Coniophora puteana RWD-64-598 SS2]EIW76725.1 P-loop containing nucleoside triphosphate hydrolase protein [Coniophora puteana RWD-64-598 SS2]
MRSFICFVLALMLAGQALAQLSIDIGGSFGNITADQFLTNIANAPFTDCEPSCNNATSMIGNCADNNVCLCGYGTVSAIQGCQQCLFDVEITNFIESPDARVGTPALTETAYGAACSTVNQTIPTSYLTVALPSNWDGPVGVHLNIAGTAIAVGVGAMLGGSALFILVDMVIELEQRTWIAIAVSKLAPARCTAVRQTLIAARSRPKSTRSQLLLSPCLPGKTKKLNTPYRRQASTFIGIRTYFTQLARNKPPGTASPLHSSSRFYSTPATSTTVPLSRDPSLEPSYTPPRWDWRQRATSRITKKLPDPPAGVPRNHIKRVPPPLHNVQPYQPYFTEIQAYASRFCPLLDAEQYEAEAVLRERLASWSVAKLAQEGYCLTDLSAYWLEKLFFGKPVLSFHKGPGIDLPEHRFEKGTQVLLSKYDPLKEEPRRGRVVDSTMTQLRVSFEDKFEVTNDELWRLDVGQSSIVFDRMRTAISHFHRDPSVQVAESSQMPDREFILQGTCLRDILLRTFSPEEASPHDPLQSPDDTNYVDHDTLEHDSRETQDHGGVWRDDMRIMSWAKRYSKKNPIVMPGDPVFDGLNATQIRAIAMMVGEKISLVQGPPGTGKTKTIIEAVKLLKVEFEVPQPILVATYTNVAVDNLVEGLLKAGLKPLRVGFGGKVNASLHDCTLDAKMEKHRHKPVVDKLLAEQERINQHIAELNKRLRERQRDPKIRDNARNQAIIENLRNALVVSERRLGIVRGKLHVLHNDMLRDITAQADVICTTCISSVNSALSVIDFPVVFLDEASMSTEPASLIPLMRGSQHVALIGDHKQLPPVIVSYEADLKGLGISLFERLTEEGVVPSIMLDVQYRMHPALSYFPSLEFYNLSLQDGTVDSGGNVSPLLLPPLSAHLPVDESTGNRPSIVFMDHAGSETLKDRSRVNYDEANIVCSIIEDLLLRNEHMRGDDIGIIAPYAAQISLLTRLLNTDAKYARRFAATLGDRRVRELSKVEVRTVDGFEGRQKDVIIFSTVRNNPAGHVGFLADRRRLNVGLTRAKRGLFVVGSISTLKQSKSFTRGMAANPGGQTSKGVESWRRYAAYLVGQQRVLHLTGTNLHRVLYGSAGRREVY